MTDPRVADGRKEQLTSWRAELQGGATRIGWKIGFNASAVQEMFGVEEPAIGFLTSTTLRDDGTGFSAAGTTRATRRPPARATGPRRRSGAPIRRSR